MASLQGVRAYLSGRAEAKRAISTKLQDLGAKVCTRLGKEVTHVIFQKSQTEEKHAQEAELLRLYDRLAQVR